MSGWMKVCCTLALSFPLSAFAHLVDITPVLPFPNTMPAQSTKYATYIVSNLSSRATLTPTEQSLFAANAGLTVTNNACDQPLAPGGTCEIQVMVKPPLGTRQISSAMRIWAKPTADGVEIPININVSDPAINQYAYVNNQSLSHYITVCSLNISGKLTACSNGVTLDSATALKVSGNFLYVLSSSEKVYVCPIKPNNGGLGTCTNASSGFDNPHAIDFNSLGTIAYVANKGANGVQACAVDQSTGLLHNCVITGSGFSSPRGISMAPQNNRIYVANRDNDSVSSCVVDLKTGLLSACALTGSGFNKPWGIVLNSAGTFAYVSNPGNNTVTFCAVDPLKGTLNACKSTGSDFSEPAQVTMNNSDTQVYVANKYTHNINSCSVDPTNGSLSRCTTSAVGFVSPTGIALY